MEDDSKSEFNMALSYLARLNYSFWTINEAKRKRDLNGWIGELSVLTDELCTEKSMKDLDAKTKELEKLMEECDAVMKKNQRMGRQSIPTQLYWKLITYERWLRKALDDAGLLKKMKESALDALK